METPEEKLFSLASSLDSARRFAWVENPSYLDFLTSASS